MSQSAKHVVQPVPPTEDDVIAETLRGSNGLSATTGNPCGSAVDLAHALSNVKTTPSVEADTVNVDSLNGSSKVLVHMSWCCDGDDCARKWLLQPIVGVRYECGSCKSDKVKHNLCAPCYDKYTFKETKLADDMKTEAVKMEPRQSGSLSSIDVSCLFGENILSSDTDIPVKDNPLHSFRCVSTPSDSADGPIRLMDKTQKQELDDRLNGRPPIASKVAGFLEFNQLDFLVRGLLLYPVGMINHLVHSLIPSKIAKRQKIIDEILSSSSEEGTSPALGRINRMLVRSTEYESYFAKLPFWHIGCCLVWNALVVLYIAYYPGRYARDTTLYWIYVYELYFAQAVTAQVQLHIKDPKNGSFKSYASAILSGTYYVSQIGTFCLTWPDIHRYAMYRRDVVQPLSPSSSTHFVFPSVTTQTTTICCVDPAKNLLKGQRQFVVTRTVSRVVSGFSNLFLYMVLLSSISAIDSTFLMYGVGSLVNLPDTITYSAESIAIMPSCRSNVGLSDDDGMARALVGLGLSPQPTKVRGLPFLTLKFYYSDNDTIAQVEEIDYSIEEIWYAKLNYEAMNYSILQLQDNQNFIAAIVSFPDLLCSNISRVSMAFDQTYSDSNQKIEDLRNSEDINSSSVWFIVFYVIVGIPALLINTIFRVASLYSVAMLTWDYWDAFNTYTVKSNIGGVWVVDRKAVQQIDFSRVENCLAWYELRKQLIEITSINLRFVFPLLCIALLQFVLSLGGISWYIILGRAPIPGFLLLLCLCTNPLPMLVVLFPLYKIWKIQYSHIAMLNTKCLELEVMPPNADPNVELHRLKALQVLEKIKNVVAASDDRVSLLGFELSPGFLGTLGTIIFSGLSFLFGGSLEYYARDS